MLVMGGRKLSRPGVSFGAGLDQYLYPLWESSVREGMDPEFGKNS